MTNLEVPYTVEINKLVIKLRDENPNADNYELKRLFEQEYNCTMILNKWFVNGIRFKSEQDLTFFLLRL